MTNNHEIRNMMNNGLDLLPALLWVPAVSPRAVIVTTGLDTLYILQCTVNIPIFKLRTYMLLCLLSSYQQCTSLLVDHLAQIVRLFQDKSLTWPNLALRRHQVSEVVVRREWNWYRVVWTRYCYLQNKLVCQGTKLLSAKEFGSLNCTSWMRSYDAFKPDQAVPLLRDCWTI